MSSDTGQRGTMSSRYVGAERAAAHGRGTGPGGRCAQGAAHLPSAGPRKGHWCGAEPLASGQLLLCGPCHPLR